MFVTRTDEATPAQIGLIEKLLDQHGAPQPIQTGSTLSRYFAGERISKEGASRLIDALIERSKTLNHPELEQEITEGMWIIGALVDGNAEVYKVQRAVHGSGRLYAKRLTDDGFEYAPGVIARLSREGVKMTLETAKMYGQLYGMCCRCGATLTDEASIAAGVGPICATKF